MTPTPPGERITSPDGFWRWDGARWMLVNPPAAEPWSEARTPSAQLVAYVSPRLPADLATMFLFVMVAASAFDIVNSALDLALIRGHLGLAAGTHLLWSENRNLLAAAVWLLIGFPGSVIAFSVWLYFVYRNLRPLGLRPAMSPGMATAWLYVPVANFWKPLAVVGELWTKLTGQPSGWLLRGWWFSFWAGCIAGIIQMQASLRETDQASRVGPLLLSFPSDVLFIVTATLLVRIVLTLTAAEERLAGLGAEKEKTPPWG